MPRAVLDASALLAVLYREPGSVMVEPYFAQVVVSSVNFSEVAAILCDRGIDSQEVLEILSGLSLEVRGFDTEQALMAGARREVTRPLGLSLGDRACLALGIAEGAPILTTDRAWADVPIETAAEVVIVR
ncbi:MAG: type II toxin-antitoxin system VapC family toxin [Acidobacteriia bacterium]|nr:type II toxin-antitoxin system VapC family toxin [Terriglobia bacterium]